MFGTWFSNRGQMIQVTCAVLALCVAVFVAWPLIITRFDVQVALQILAYPAAVFIVFQLGKRFGSDAVSTVSAYRTEASFFNPNLKIGSYWETGEATLDKMRVTVISTQNYKLGPYDDLLGAELEVKAGVSSFKGGKRTKSTNHDTFLVPASSSPYAAEDSSLVNFVTAKQHIYFTSVRVDHINLPSQEVSLEICRFISTKI